MSLFGIHVYKRGLLPPKDFFKLVEDKVETAPLLAEGSLGEPVFEEVRSGALPGMPFEGVVCKERPRQSWASTDVQDQEHALAGPPQGEVRR